MLGAATIASGLAVVIIAGLDRLIHGSGYVSANKFKYASIAFENFAWATFAETFLTADFFSRGVEIPAPGGGWQQDLAGGQMLADAVLGFTQAGSVVIAGIGDLVLAATGSIGEFRRESGTQGCDFHSFFDHHVYGVGRRG